MIEIKPYAPADKELWDDAVDASRNGLFQHRRDYMDYHADRFADCSLFALDDKGRVVAVLPAHAVGTTVCSHRGLTFGGWLMGKRADMLMMMEIWQKMTEHYASQDFKELYYRPAPHIYHTYPAEEDLYALFRAGGLLEATQVSSVVDLSAPIGFDMSARQSVRKAAKAGVVVSETEDYDTFWIVLGDVLLRYHEASPVHTIDEIKLLHSRFPDEIKLYAAYLDGRMLGGVVMYYGATAAHSQYTAASDEGRSLRILPLIYDYIIGKTVERGVRWFDFGTSCEDAGRILNEGLIRQKIGFGARAVAYNAYTVPLLLR